jgi:hypothetical protein
VSDTRPPNDEVAEGRRLTVVNLGRIGGVAALVTWIASARTDGPSTAATAARLGLIALSAALVYRGVRWALWLLGALTLGAAGMMVVIAATGGLSWPDAVVFAVGGLVSILAFIILLRAPEVKAFMTAQRERSRRPPS